MALTALSSFSSNSLIPFPRYNRRQTKSRECQNSIYYQQLITELISPHLLRHIVKRKAQERRRHGYVWHKSVLRFATRKESEGKQSQERTIGVGTENVNSIDHARGVEHLEQQYKQHKQHGNAHMSTTAQTLVALASSDVNALACGKGSESRVGT